MFCIDVPIAQLCDGGNIGESFTSGEIFGKLFSK